MLEERNRDWNEEEGGEGEEQYTSNTEQDLSRQSVLLDLEEDDDDETPLGADERLERLSAEDNAVAVLNELSDYTEDQEILDDFAERQMMPTDEQGLTRRLREHHSESPVDTAGDIDAAWHQAEDVGDETPAAEPMPDHDRVGEIGQALGVTYDDDEELDFAAKVWQRDDERYELDIDSRVDDVDNEDRAENEALPIEERMGFEDEEAAENEDNDLDEGPIDPMDFSLLDEE